MNASSPDPSQTSTFDSQPHMQDLRTNLPARSEASHLAVRKEIIDLTADGDYCGICSRAFGQGSGDAARIFVFQTSCCVSWYLRLFVYANQCFRPFVVVAFSVCRKNSRRQLYRPSVGATDPSVILVSRMSKKSSPLSVRFAINHRSNASTHHVVRFPRILYSFGLTIGRSCVLLDLYH